MGAIDYLCFTIGAIITLSFYLLCYKKIDDKVTISKTFFISVPILSIITIINTYYNYTYTKLLISFVIILLNNYFAYREEKNTLLIKSLIIYLVVVFCEVLCAIVISLTSITNIIDFDNNVIIKVVFSCIVMSLTYGIFNIKFIKTTSSYLIKKIDNKMKGSSFLIASLLIVIFLAYKFIFSFDTKTYIMNFLILICFSVLIISSIYNYIKTKKMEERQETLLNFMTKYEKIIDNDRINRHEMLNNLLIIRSFNKKDKKGFDEFLDDLIDTYSKTGSTIKNVYSLPSGLKGILYYKINDMESIGLKVALKIDDKTKVFLKKINSKDYCSICKVFSIVLDNARDASCNSSEKHVLIDFIVTGKILIITVENTFDGKVNINRIKDMNYSTKGKGRGLGLYIANNIIKENELISLEQRIIMEKYFSSKIIIKKPEK